MTGEPTISRCANAVAREVGDGVTVILDLDDGVYYRVDAVGTAVWALLDERPRTVDEISQAIATDHGVDTDECRRDVLAFVDDMAAAGLVAIGASETG